MTDDQIDEAIRIFEERAENVAARTGVKPEATVGQVMVGVDPKTGRAIQSFEGGLEKLGEDVGVAARKSQEEAQEALQREMFGGAPAKDLTKAVPVGEAIQDTATRDVLAKKQDILRGIFTEQAELLTEQLSIVDVIPTTTTAAAIRNYLIKARADVLGPEGQLSKQYDEFWSQVPDTTVDMSGVQKTGKKWKALIDSDLFKTLTEENRKIIEDAISVPEAATMDQVTRALSLLKSELRTLKAVPAAAKAREGALLSDLVVEVQKARDSALSGIDTSIRDQIYALDEAFALAKDKIDGSLINRLITKKKGGGMRVSDDKFMDAILRNPAEARNIMGLMNSPDYVGFGLTDAFKDGALGVYRDKVIDGTMTHKSFMNQYKASLREIFTPVQMRKFSNLEDAAKGIKLAEKREKILLDQVNKSFEMKLTGFDPEKVLDQVAGSPSRTKKLVALLKNDPDKLADYKALRARKLLNDLESTDDLGNVSIDFTKIEQILKKEKGELSELYGEQFISDMRMLKDITKMRLIPNQIKTYLTDLIKETPPATPGILFWRSSVARPLSRMGLLTTAAMKLDRRAARKATAALLSSPKAMREATNLYRADAPLRKWKSLLMDIGAIELVRHFNEVEE